MWWRRNISTFWISVHAQKDYYVVEGMLVCWNSWRPQLQSWSWSSAMVAVWVCPQGKHNGIIPFFTFFLIRAITMQNVSSSVPRYFFFISLEEKETFLRAHSAGSLSGSSARRGMSEYDLFSPFPPPSAVPTNQPFALYASFLDAFIKNNSFQLNLPTRNNLRRVEFFWCRTKY